MGPGSCAPPGTAAASRGGSGWPARATAAAAAEGRSRSPTQQWGVALGASKPLPPVLGRRGRLHRLMALGLDGHARSPNGGAAVASSAHLQRLAAKLQRVASKVGRQVCERQPAVHQEKEQGARAALAAQPAPPAPVDAEAARVRARYLLRVGLITPPGATERRAPLPALAGEAEAAPVVPLAAEAAVGNGKDFRGNFLRALSYREVWIPAARRPRAHETVSIFDWDDTLLCTSSLEPYVVQGKALPCAVYEELRSIGKAAADLLELALQSGRTLIVTNAREGWVESSAATYLPELLPLLQRVQIVSARSLYEARFPQELANWKRSVFFDLRKKLPPQAVVNCIVLGDSLYEMSAAISMGRAFSGTTIKAIKFKEEPTPAELLSQLQVVVRRFTDIVSCGQSLIRRVSKGPIALTACAKCGGA